MKAFFRLIGLVLVVAFLGVYFWNSRVTRIKDRAYIEELEGQMEKYKREAEDPEFLKRIENRKSEAETLRQEAVKEREMELKKIE